MSNKHDSKILLIMIILVLTTLLIPEFSTEASPLSQPYTPNFIYHPLITGLHQPWAAYSVDLDKDGDKDVLASGHFPGLVWLENDGNENFTQRVIDDWQTGHSTTAADLDNDEDIDIFLVTCGSASQVIWFENDGSQNFTRHLISRYVYETNCPSPPSPIRVYAGDVNRDGLLDLVVSANHSACGVISWFENDGAKNFIRHDLVEDFTNAQDALPLDLDQDGDADILGAGADIGQLAWWKNDGTQHFTKQVITSDFNGATSVDPVDMDGDGDLDVLGSAIYTDQVAWFENDGSQSFVKHVIDSQFGGASITLAADMNNDGYLDVVGAGGSVDEIALWVNNGVQSFTKYVLSSTFDDAYFVYADDMDNDGDLDILGVAIGGTVAWWENDSQPVVNASGPYSIDEGKSVIISAVGSDPDDSIVAYAWDLDHDGFFETPGQSVTFSAENLDGPGSRTVAVQVTNQRSLTATDQAEITILNVAPTAIYQGSGSITEGNSFDLNFSDAYDPSAADTAVGLTYSFDCANDGLFEATSSGSSFDCKYPDNGLFTTRGRIIDKDGGFTDYTGSVSVNNLPPVVGSITAQTAPLQIGNVINASAPFSDAGVLDTHIAQWNWGDGTLSDGIVIETNGSGSVNGTHSYTTPGVYTVSLYVTDKDGGVGTSIYQFVVVYDPNGGFVTGGGWINSPEGAYLADLTLTGKANFGFVAKYQKGANEPTGNTEFQFKAGDLNFHSENYDWLVVAGAKAQFKGMGTINGMGTYKFMLTAIDGQLSGGGGVDKFRIKIWWEDASGIEHIVYDNQLGSSLDADPTTAIQGGSIVIHK